MSSPEEIQTKPVQVKTEDMARIDRASDILEKQTGGFFSKGRVLSRALDALELELGVGPGPEKTLGNQTIHQ